MERKTKNRILGIIVMAALVIALLPLFHGSNTDVKPDPQATNAPPFPDQSTQASDNATPEFRVALANQTSPIPFKNNGENESAFNQLPDDTINPNSSKAYNNAANKPAPSQNPSATITKPVVSVDEDNDIIDAPVTSGDDSKSVKEASSGHHPQNTETIFRNSLETELQAATKASPKKAMRSTRTQEPAALKIKQARRKTHPPLDENGLFKLKNSAWVIQLGSYKNKANALRLVNRLRASGYSAFIQQASAGTRVYVGPETKEDIARSIATRLEYEMKIQGFVISYKPLTL